MSSFSAFEIIGPPMVGPSSSHTAGACRIGWAARAILGEEPVKANVFLHGSFAATGVGHGTHEALTAGLLGWAPDDERLKSAPHIAEEQNFIIKFSEIDLGPQAHPNSARVQILGAKATSLLTAASIGGGSIRIIELDDFPVEISGRLETLLLWHRDTSGFLARVTAILGSMELNVASIRTSRKERGEEALTTIEIDETFPPEVVALLRRMPAISRLNILPILPGT